MAPKGTCILIPRTWEGSLPWQRGFGRYGEQSQVGRLFWIVCVVA